MIRVLIVDDMKILCQGLKVTLNQSREIDVVGEAYNGKDAVTICKVKQPDVILMDMHMPDYDGAYATSIIKKEYPNIKILVLTTFDDEETVKTALQSGADGYILKEMDDEMIISSVKSVYYGVNVLGNTIFSLMKDSIDGIQSCKEKLNITQREYEFLLYVSKGYSNKEIAEILCLAEGTVRNAISKLLEKFQLKDRTQLAVYAVKNGICWKE